MNDNQRAAFMRKRRCRVFVDGREIHSVFYYDGRRKIVKTYDVYDEGSGGTVTRDNPRPVNPSWSAPPDGVLSKTIRGKHLRMERIA